MVWFFLIPSVPTTLGNFLLPLMIGARDVAFPRLNLWRVGICSLEEAPSRSGPSSPAESIRDGLFYTPYSSTYANGHVIAMATGIFMPASAPSPPD